MLLLFRGQRKRAKPSTTLGAYSRPRQILCPHSQNLARRLCRYKSVERLQSLLQMPPLFYHATKALADSLSAEPGGGHA